MDRKSRKEQVDKAYELQSKAAIAGAARSTAVGLGLAVIGHYTWPAFRRQTLPFKGFLVSVCTIFGLIVGAENALLAHEAERRQTETVLRKQARIDIARRGLVATEAEIAKWKAERLAAAQQAQSDTDTHSSP